MTIKEQIKAFLVANDGEFTLAEIHDAIGGRKGAVQVALWRMKRDHEVIQHGQAKGRNTTFSLVPDTAPSSTEAAS